MQPVGEPGQDLPQVDVRVGSGEKPLGALHSSLAHPGAGRVARQLFHHQLDQGVDDRAGDEQPQVGQDGADAGDGASSDAGARVREEIVQCLVLLGNGSLSLLRGEKLEG